MKHISPISRIFFLCNEFASLTCVSTLLYYLRVAQAIDQKLVYLWRQLALLDESRGTPKSGALCGCSPRLSLHHNSGQDIGVGPMNHIEVGDEAGL